MRYQNPSIESAIGNLVRKKISEIFLVPLFPHYAMSSFETAVERVRAVLNRLGPGIELRVAEPFYNEPAYIEALVGSAEPSLGRGFDHLLFSFHGLPERQIRKSDPTGRHCLAAENCCATPSPAHRTCYRAQCFQTTRAFVDRAGIPAGQYSIAFQSRLGRDPWLRPYSDHEIERMAHSGVKRLTVICPAFVSDCLETLEEMGIRGRRSFLDAGGTEFTLVPCLNEHPLWLSAIEKLIARGLRREREPRIADRKSQISNL
jgi:ferrochelatase